MPVAATPGAPPLSATGLAAGRTAPGELADRSHARSGLKLPSGYKATVAAAGVYLASIVNVLPPGSRVTVTAIDGAGTPARGTSVRIVLLSAATTSHVVPFLSVVDWASLATLPVPLVLVPWTITSP